MCWTNFANSTQHRSFLVVNGLDNTNNLTWLVFTVSINMRQIIIKILHLDKVIFVWLQVSSDDDDVAAMDFLIAPKTQEPPKGKKEQVSWIY